MARAREAPDPPEAGNPERDGEEDAVTGRLVGMGELRAAFRRRRRFFLAVAASGLLAGAALHVVLPHRYKAVSNLYLVEPPSVIPADAMANEVSLLQTRAVARQAASLLPGHPTTQSVASSYKGDAVSGSILSVSATGASPAKAVELDTAVARAFLEVRSEEFQREADVVVAGLRDQIAALKGSSSSVQLQRSQLQSSELATELNSRSSVKGSFVLDPAQTVKVSSKKVAIVDMLSGLVAGLGLAGGIVVMREMLSDRAWRREDVAVDLGAAVELSLTRPRRWGRFARRRAGAGPEHPAVTVGRRLRAHLDALSSRSLAVFAVEDEGLAAEAVASLASELTGEGREAFVVDMAKGRPVARHFGIGEVPGPVQRVQLGDRSLSVLVVPDHPVDGVDPSVRDRNDYLLVLADVDPAFGVEDVGAWASDGVAIVSAGKATHFRLVGIGRMIRRAGIALRSTILVNADPHDESVGLLDADVPRARPSRAIEATVG